MGIFFVIILQETLNHGRTRHVRIQFELCDPSPATVCHLCADLDPPFWIRATFLENTEGEYAGLEHEVVPGAAESLKMLANP
uniref:Uncharacterized protein n=1 Tax=Salix viminalis TaxID=40686 RepID=A0A6N2MY07_SALVM